VTARDLLAELQARGVELVAAGDKLRYRPRSAVEPGLIRVMREHKAEIMALLTGAPAPRSTAAEPEPPHELSLAERVAMGYVNPGWTAESWRDRLHQLADRCETLRPELAAQYRAWARNAVTPFD